MTASADHTTSRRNIPAITWPHKLRIAINEQCNFSCVYCRPFGDGCASSLAESKAPFLSPKEIETIALLFERAGSRKLNITGGEPTLRGDLDEIIDRVLRATTLRVTLNTNGTRPIAFPELAPSQRERLSCAVSCDSAEVATSRRIGRPNAPALVRRFLAAANDVNVKCRLNMVLVKNMNDSIEQLEHLIAMADEFSSDIKIQTVFDLGGDQFKQYSDLYVQIGSLENEIISRGFSFRRLRSTQNGVPEKVYMREGTVLTLLDKAPAQTLFAPVCNSCSLFPCDTGMFSFYVNAHGDVSICRHIDRPLIELRPLLELSEEAVLSRLKWQFGKLVNVDAQNSYCY